MGAMFDAVTDWENLWRAFRMAARGKRRRASAALFEHQVADRLVVLQRELSTQAYRPGAYCHFFIHEPKRRKISAAPFRDRVVHHALCNVMAPIVETRFIEHSYANRVARGTHRAIESPPTMGSAVSIHAARRHRSTLPLAGSPDPAYQACQADSRPGRNVARRRHPCQRCRSAG